MSMSEIKYLITVYDLAKNYKKVRQIDIAECLQYSKASVSIAMDNLECKRLIKKDDNGSIVILPAGAAIAEQYIKCAEKVEGMLINKLSSRASAAKSDALKIICAMSKENFDRLCALTNNKELGICQ